MNIFVGFILSKELGIQLRSKSNILTGWQVMHWCNLARFKQNHLDIENLLLLSSTHVDIKTPLRSPRTRESKAAQEGRRWQKV